MLLIDSHTHLYLKEFDADIHDAISRSIAAGVSILVLPNIDSASVAPMLQLSNQYKNICYPAIGLHPGSVNQDYKVELENMKTWLTKDNFYAIGEVGIDLYWDKTFIHEQVEAFKYQLHLAKEFDLPVIIHSRNALNEIISIIKEKEFTGVKAVFHCFPGSMEQAVYLTGLGFKLGIGGVVTYKNSGLAKIVKELPLEHILLETDAPYLPPVPYRGQRNESAYIKTIAEFIANLKSCTLEEVAEVTAANTKRFFRI